MSTLYNAIVAYAAQNAALFIPYNHKYVGVVY